MLRFSWFVPLKSGVFQIIQHSKEHCKGGISTYVYATMKEDHIIQYWILLVAVFLNSKSHWRGEELQIYTVLCQGWCLQMLIYKPNHQKSEQQPVANGEIWEKETSYYILVKRRASHGEDKGSKWWMNGYNLTCNLTAILLQGDSFAERSLEVYKFCVKVYLLHVHILRFITTKREGSKLSNVFIALASQRALSWEVTALFWIRPRL